MIRHILHPELYHGIGKQPPFFEGWYYKLVNKSETKRFAFIPGIFLHNDPAKRHAFVQVLDGSSGSAVYHDYSPSEFRPSGPPFELRIGNNRFTTDSLSIDIGKSSQQIRGELRFEGMTPWPVTVRSPGIMGWYAWVPFMECYHGVLSMDHEISGSLMISGEEIDFSGGRGYIEKDWGRSFPSAHIWMQTNHFGIAGASLSASVAIIPWVRSSFLGFIVGFLSDGRLHRFATYTGARIRSLSVTDTDIHWVIEDPSFELAMHATRSGGGLLHAPTTTEMSPRLLESLTAQVHIELRHRPGPTIFSAAGHHAGLEVGGNTSALLAYLAQRS